MIAFAGIHYKGSNGSAILVKRRLEVEAEPKERGRMEARRVGRRVSYRYAVRRGRELEREGRRVRLGEGEEEPHAYGLELRRVRSVLDASGLPLLLSTE